MRRIGRNSLILLALVLATGLLGSQLSRAGDADSRIRIKDRSRIVIVDDDGSRHEEVFEFDQDHPRPFLGVVLDGTDGEGARIDRVLENTAAERSGLREGDVIVRFDGETVDSPYDLTHQLLRTEPGDTVDVEVLRDGRTETFTVEVGQRDFAFRHVAPDLDSEEFQRQMEQLEEHLENLDFQFEFDGQSFGESMERLREGLENLDFDFDFDLDDLHFDDRGHHGAWVMRSDRPLLGVELVGTTPELRRHLGGDGEAGVLVGKVISGMPAERADVRVGDLIVAVGSETIEDAGDLRRALRDRRGQTFDLEVIRDGSTVVLSVELPEPEQRDDVEGSSERPQPWHRLTSADKT